MLAAAHPNNPREMSHGRLTKRSGSRSQNDIARTIMMLIKKRNSAVFQALTPCVSATTRTNTDIRLNNIAEDIIHRTPCRAFEMGFCIFLLTRSQRKLTQI
jgi:hypothetical protein